LRKLGLEGPPPAWTEEPTDVYQVVRMMLFALKGKYAMRPVTGRMVSRARALLGLELEQADEEGIRDWARPYDDDYWHKLLEDAGIDPDTEELVDPDKFKQALEALEVEQAEIKRRKTALKQRTVTGELKSFSNGAFPRPWRPI